MNRQPGRSSASFDEKVIPELKTALCETMKKIDRCPFDWSTILTLHLGSRKELKRLGAKMMMSVNH